LRPDTCDIALCSCFDTADLVSYGQVCRDARRAVKAYSAQAYQLRRTLVNFMGEDDVLTLRKVMRSTGTLISGSVALHYFNRTPVGHSGLDLYIEGGTAMELVSFVLTLGYVYMPRMYQNHDLRTAVKHATYRYAVRDLAIHDLPAILDKISFDRDGTKIHVMIADLSALDAIMDFHSTPVMNFISYRSAYSLYPFHTFVQMFGILLIETIAHNHVDKYRNLGWRIQRSVTQAEYAKIGQELKAPLRYVGDKHTWTIDLDDFAGRYLDPVILNSWELQWSYRPLNFIMPQVARMLYIAPRHWIQSRMFATSDLMKAFMVALTRLEPAEKMQTTFDFMDAAFASAQEFLFDSSPPCVTDVIMLGPYQRHYRRARLPVVTFVGDRIEEEEHEVSPCVGANPYRTADPIARNRLSRAKSFYVSRRWWRMRNCPSLPLGSPCPAPYPPRTKISH
ncbi:hypothetical protein FB107DRAFT_224034, partial [Schizophyllum commune]